MSGHGTPRIPPTGAANVPAGATPAPSNFLLGPNEYLANQTLPAAGAFTAPSQFAVPAGTKRVTFWIKYAIGAAGGFPLFEPEFWYNQPGVGLVQGRSTVQDLGSFTSAAPDGTTKFYEEVLSGPAPADATPILYELTFLLPCNVVAVDLLAAEGGVPGTPGALEIFMTGEG